jgi:hypothetical protein
MANFSLINIRKENSDGTIIVEGEWIQNAVACTLEEATQRAIGYERKVWGVQTHVGVVAELPSPTPQGVWGHLKRLDKSRRYS